jgi:hypothetical protein
MPLPASEAETVRVTEVVFAYVASALITNEVTPGAVES